MDSAQLFRDHHVAVFRYLRRWVGDPAVAEELMQDTFVRVIRAADQYRPEGRERSWVFTIAHRVSMNWRRSTERRPETQVWQEHDGLSPADAATALSLSRAVAMLGDHEREVFLLREVGGLNYEEIAAVVGTTVPAVRSRLARARIALRQVLGAPSELPTASNGGVR